jgi:hypothetical protein
MPQMDILCFGGEICTNVPGNRVTGKAEKHITLTMVYANPGVGGGVLS